MDPKQFRRIIKEELKPVIKTQQTHSKILEGQTETLQKHSEILDEHSEKLAAITGELHQVHKLADATLDVVKGRYEKNKREIDEVKDHLGLPKEPYFGEQS